VRDESRLFDVERVQDAGDVNRLILLRVPGVRVHRQTHAAQVRHNHGMVPDQVRREGSPHVAGIAEPMQQNDSRTLPAHAHVKARAIGLHHLGVETCGKRLDACAQRH
jgi:hypothetical protein